MKVLKKSEVVRLKQVEHTNNEKMILERVEHPFLINLWGTFHDVRNLYMVMDYVVGGELFSVLRKSQVNTLVPHPLPPSSSVPDRTHIHKKEGAFRVYCFCLVFLPR